MIWSSASEIVEIVASLVSKSLLNADVATAIAHYRLLDTTRAYALKKLTESGEFDHTARRHAKHILSLLQRAAPMRRYHRQHCAAAPRMSANQSSCR